MRISDWSSDVCSSDLFDTDADELRVVAPQLDLAHLIDGNAGKLHLRPLAQPVDRLIEVVVIFALRVPAVVRHPADDDRDCKGDEECEAAHQHIVHASLYQRDRTSVVPGQSVSLRVNTGGRRSINKKIT